MDVQKKEMVTNMQSLYEGLMPPLRKLTTHI